MIERVYEPTQHGVRPPRLAEHTLSLWRARFAISQMVSSNLRARYQRSVLGVAWTLIHPLLMLAVLTVVFGSLFRIDIERFPVYLFAGMLPWQFFAQAIAEGSRSLIEREGLVRRMPVPLLAFPLVSVCIAATHGLIAMLALSLLLPLFSYSPSVHLIILPAAAALLAMFAFGAVLVTMTLVTYFRDVEHFVSVALQALYFATPILYTPALVPELDRFLSVNPLRWLLSLFQNAIYAQSWPTLEAWLAASGSAIAMMLIGLFVYQRCEHSYVFRL